MLERCLRVANFRERAFCEVRRTPSMRSSQNSPSAHSSDLGQEEGPELLLRSDPQICRCPSLSSF
jgi:hypothetical protein